MFSYLSVYVFIPSTGFFLFQVESRNDIVSLGLAPFMPGQGFSSAIFGLKVLSTLIPVVCVSLHNYSVVLNEIARVLGCLI